MKEYAKINYSYRPKSYWQDISPLEVILKDVKGVKRRELIREAFSNGQFDQLNDELTAGTLSEDVRQRLGNLHPSFMGGEYLPDFDRGEVDIAVICLDSTTSDVITLRARSSQGWIHYRIVDEYKSRFVLSCEKSLQPLSLSELIHLIDHSYQSECLYGYGLALDFNYYNLEDHDSRESLRYFTSVFSTFHPELCDHYEHVYDEWVVRDEDDEWEAYPSKPVDKSRKCGIGLI